MAWRQRIYAFLLRRILGPYLAPSSAQKLHRCVEVSLTEGRFVLTEVDLDPDKLNALLFSVGGEAPPSGGLRVRRARVRKLGIYLSLREGGDADDDGDGALRRTDSDPSEALTVGMAMNTVSKAYRLSYRTASDVGAASSVGGGVALMAHIEIDGLEIDLAPMEATEGKTDRHKKVPQRKEDKAEKSGGGYISSYVDAALASLRLTLSISDVSVRAFDRLGLIYVALRLAKASYHDSVAGTNESTNYVTSVEQTTSVEEVVLHKSVGFDGLTIEVGSNPAADGDNWVIQRTVAETDGPGSFRLHAIAVREETGRGSLTDPKPLRIQREVDATLCKRLSFTLDAASLGCMATVLRDVERCAAASRDSSAAEDGMAESDLFGGAVMTAAVATDTTPFPLANNDFSSGASYDGGDDTAEAQHISEMMRQYTEARHLARTREVRGGMLLPSFSFDESGENSGKGGGEVAFDMFFDANEQSFHHYRSMVSEVGGWQSKAHDNADSSIEHTGEFVHTRVALRLPSCSLKCIFEDEPTQAMTGDKDGKGSESMITILDCALSMTISETGSDATFSASHFQIEDFFMDSRTGAVEKGCVLRFLDPSEMYQDAEIDDSGGAYIVSSAPCLSVDFVKRYTGGRDNGCGETTLTVVLDPMELMYRQETASHFSKLFQCVRMDDETEAEVVVTGAADNSPERDDTPAGPTLRVKATCPTLTILFSVAHPSSETDFDSFGPRFSPLFERIGYGISSVDETAAKIPGIGLTFDEVSLELSMQTISEAGDTDDMDISASPLVATSPNPAADEMAIEMKCHNAIMFGFTTPSDSASFVTRADVVAFQGESNIDSMALVKVKYQSVQPRHSSSRKGARKLKRNNNSFPLVPPLSAVKATQPHDEKKPENLCSPSKGSRGAGPRRHRGKRQHQHVRASDPQYAMSAEAADSNRNIDVSIPSMAFDLTTKERIAFLDMISALQARSTTGNEDDTFGGDRGPDQSQIEKKDLLCFSLSCKRLSVTLHGSEEDFVGAPELSDVLGGGSTHVSYILIADGMRLHALLGTSGGLRNIRICSHDLTLYEVIDLLPGTHTPPVVGSQRRREHFRRRRSSETAYERCCIVRKRCSSRNESTREARPILFRQQLHRPLSPETSAFILDVLNRSWGTGEDSDDDINETSGDMERSIYFSLYDLTYRCDIESHWRQRLMSLVRGGEADESDRGSCGSKKCTVGREGPALLTNLFVTLSDCTLDYSSPLHFATPSRSRLRFGEIRLTSNIISPPAVPKQTYKLSVADFEHHLCNHRVPSDAEDARLSCSGSVLRRSASSGRVAKTPTASSIEDATRRMGFVTVATLESADAMLTVVHEADSMAVSSRVGKGANRKPDTTLTLSFGRVCLYTCRDSFACFTDTFSEWITEVTTPSEEDMIRLKALPTPVQDADDDLLGNSIFPEESNNSIGKENDDTNSLPASNAMGRDLTDVPDSELSAAELRKKHGLAQNGMSDGLSGSLFSKDFGSMSSPAGERQEKRSKSEASMLASYPSRRAGRASTDSECRLGGHGWTTVDHEWSQRSDIPPGQEQSAKWLTGGNQSRPSQSKQHYRGELGAAVTNGARQQIHVVHHHIPKDSGGLFRSGASAAADGFSPEVKLRVAVSDLSVNFRFFDGYDWMDSPISNDGLAEAKMKAMKEQTNEELLRDEHPDKLAMLQRRAELIGELLDGCEYQDAMFGDDLRTVYLLKHQTTPALKREQRKARQTGRYFSLVASGVRLQYDSFLDSADHRLSSRMNLSTEDLFIAETVSDERKPVKLLGEWFNEKEHPRDSDDGLLMMKMVSMHPVKRISDDGKYINDESRVTLQLLPLRFFLHQKAIRFIKKFFTRDESAAEGSVAEKERKTVEVTPTFFQRFKVFATKLKVDYQPERCDTAALKDGSYVELINLLPLEDMVLTLQPIELINITGWGSAISEVSRCWLRDICATQMHKFITNTSPFHPILNVGGGVAEMFMIPIEEVKDGGSFLRGLRDGTAALAGTVAYEALNTTSRASKFAANALSGASSSASSRATSGAPVVALPARPSETPSKVGQVARHAVDSVSRGLEEANYKIIIVPCREYSRTGTTGAVKSVIRGIPVAVRAPLSGASEAVSYATLLARNAINPDKRKEEEATFKGLTSD